VVILPIEGVKLMQDLGTFHAMAKWPTTQKTNLLVGTIPPNPNEAEAMVFPRSGPV
jgi:hypothetical protein